ncbi:MAG TPA: acyl-CoA dehydrogenase [Pseudomonadales bacterium]|nr:acyl-CoA dehydrogenase [Pseudomonadales bacterium]
MNFTFSEEQNLLRDSIRKFVQSEYDFEKRRKLANSELGYSKENWSKFAELGWLAVPFSEEDGGFGGGAVDVMIVMEELGKGLVLEPYLANVVLAGSLLSKLATAEQKNHYLTAMISGEMQFALAYSERTARFNLASVDTTAEVAGADYVLNGAKAVVLNGHAADTLIVVARTAGNSQDKRGISLFLVDANAAGVTRTAYATAEGVKVADVQFNNVRVGSNQLLGTAGAAFDALESAVDEAIVALSAEAQGVMETLLYTTVQYTKTRKQFGMPIGAFQVLQHRMVEMFMECEQMRSLLYMATLHQAKGGKEAKIAASAVKAQLGKAARYVGQQAIQLHGGMGMTDELNVGYYFKRLEMMGILFGNTDYHLARYVELTA